MAEVDLSKVTSAFANYPKDPAITSVKAVQRGLVAEELYAGTVDGLPGTDSREAYRKWQVRLGFNGTEVDGIPGRTSLTRLGNAHGFAVTL